MAILIARSPNGPHQGEEEGTLEGGNNNSVNNQPCITIQLNPLLHTTIHILRLLFSRATFSSCTASCIIMENMYIKERARLLSVVGTNSYSQSVCGGGGGTVGVCVGDSGCVWGGQWVCVRGHSGCVGGGVQWMGGVREGPQRSQTFNFFLTSNRQGVANQSNRLTMSDELSSLRMRGKEDSLECNKPSDYMNIL